MMDYTLQKFSVTSDYDGTVLSCLVTVPETDIRGIVQFSHGMAENKERYQPLMEYLSSHGYLCLIHDHRGHGASAPTEDDLGYFGKNGSTAVVKDLHQLTEYAKKTWPGHPVYLFGHSMGSLAARCYLSHYSADIDALILSGAPSKNPAAGFALFLADISTALLGGRHRNRLITALAFGPYQARFAGEPMNSWICSDPHVVSAYNESPLCGFSFTNNGYQALFHLMLNTYDARKWQTFLSKRPANRQLPILFLAGENDPCITDEKHFLAEIQFLKDQGFTNINSKLYPAMRHEICNEVGKEVVWMDVLEFLLAQGKSCN